MAKPVFDCKRCNECCTGEGGIVFQESELTAAARLLGLETGQFARRYCRRIQQGYEVVCGQDGRCALLGPEGCLVHAAKPAICRRWPFFEALLKDAGAFEEAKLSCRGMDPEATHADFLAQARRERNST